MQQTSHVWKTCLQFINLAWVFLLTSCRVIHPYFELVVNFVVSFYFKIVRRKGENENRTSAFYLIYCAFAYKITEKLVMYISHQVFNLFSNFLNQPRECILLSRLIQKLGNGRLFDDLCLSQVLKKWGLLSIFMKEFTKRKSFFNFLLKLITRTCFVFIVDFTVRLRRSQISFFLKKDKSMGMKNNYMRW